MSNTDVVSYIVSLFTNDMVEIMPIIGGILAVAIIVKLLSNYVFETIR